MLAPLGVVVEGGRGDVTLEGAGLDPVGVGTELLDGGDVGCDPVVTLLTAGAVVMLELDVAVVILLLDGAVVSLELEGTVVTLPLLAGVVELPSSGAVVTTVVMAELGWVVTGWLLEAEDVTLLVVWPRAMPSIPTQTTISIT